MTAAPFGHHHGELGQRGGDRAPPGGAARRRRIAGALGAARPRAEHERGVEGGLPSKELAVVEDDGTPVEELAHLDAAVRERPAPPARWDIDDSGPEAHGGIASDDAVVPAPDQPVEIRGTRRHTAGAAAGRL